MSAVVALGPSRRLAQSEFTAPRGARVLARGVFFYVLVVGTFSMVSAMSLENLAYHPEAAAVTGAIVLFCAAIGALGLVARTARLRIDAQGVRWGFASFGFWMRRERIGVIRVYRDAVAVVPRRGGAWYLSSRDWAPWERLVDTVRASEIPTETHDRRAPLRAKLQGYGVALDLLLLLAFLTQTATVIFI